MLPNFKHESNNIRIYNVSLHLVYKDIPILAACSAGLASRKTLPCPAQIIDKVCSAALQIQEEKKGSGYLTAWQKRQAG